MDYNLPSGYFFTALFCYLLVFITLSVSMARSYRKSFIETSGGLNNVYANKVFCSWDFGIATGEAAALKSKSIYNELKELLNESADILEESSCVTWFYTVSVQVCLNLLSLLLMGGTGMLMWFLLTQQFDDAATDQSDEHTHSMMMSLVVTIIMMFSPIFFSWLIRFEYYENPRTVLYMTLMRTFFLKMIVIGVLVAFWLKRSNRKCWETSLGQEVYRLILTDFLIAIVGTALAELVRNRIYKTVWKGIGVPKFDIARNTLNLIYNQTLFFVGLYFSPLLPLIIVLKMFITFHIKKLGALKNCQASAKSWRAAQTQTVFLGLAFLSLLGVLVTYGYILFKVQASDCGPFSGYTYMYQMILEEVFQLHDDNNFIKFIVFLTKPGVVGGILLAMCVCVYYLRAKSQAHTQMVDILREMLVSEAKDKEFLMTNIMKVSERKMRLHNAKNEGFGQSPSRRASVNQGSSRGQSYMASADNIVYADSNSSSRTNSEWILRPKAGNPSRLNSDEVNRRHSAALDDQKYYQNPQQLATYFSNITILPSTSSDNFPYYDHSDDVCSHSNQDLGEMDKSRSRTSAHTRRQ